MANLNYLKPAFNVYASNLFKDFSDAYYLYRPHIVLELRHGAASNQIGMRDIRTA